MLVALLAVLTACNNSASVENQADSLSREIDSFGNKVWDSTKKGAKELKDRIEEKFEKKDSATK
jgi:hypothetical protein